jgi:hypothetical protein
MKTILTLGILVAIIGSVSADPQKSSLTATPTRPNGARAAATPPPVYSHEKVQGAVVRGFRGGNPLQMLNPKAPARYGNWVQSTSFDPNVPGKWKGIKLFEFIF